MTSPSTSTVVLAGPCTWQTNKGTWQTNKGALPRNKGAWSRNTGACLAVALAAVVSLTCGDATTDVDLAELEKPATVTVSPDAPLLPEGDTVRLRATAANLHGQTVTNVEFVWATTNAAVATVDAAGLVTGVAEGQAEVTASTAGVTGRAAVTVEVPAPTTLSVAPDTVSLNALGHTAQLVAVVQDQGGRTMEGVEVEWSSADTAVAVVSSAGLVTAVGVGASAVTARAGDAVGSAHVMIDGERVALAALYYATDGPNWVNSENWVTDAPLASWYGVDTDADGRVLRLDLSGGSVRHGLYGEIPPEIGHLGRLEVLHLARNRLYGDIPPEFGQMASLRSLDLDNNHFTGIPDELGGLANLHTLRLNANEFTGEIPAAITDLVNLETLSLSWNGFSGIPSAIGNLANLRWLYLRGNQLVGEIPAAIGDLVGLETLDMGRGRLTGEIPVQIGSLTNLRRLSLDSNRLSGDIPLAIGNLAGLAGLQLSYNRLTGQIPPKFLQRGFELLRIGGNNGLCVPGTAAFVSWLRGIETRDREEPLCNAADVAALESLFEATGGLGWTESAGWLASPALEAWWGVTTDSLGRATELALPDNNLTGSLPRAIGDLDQLTRLRIEGNPLEGRLPLEMTALYLEELHYGDTGLCAPTDAGFRDWLDAIPSLQDNAVQCQPLTEREALAALYNSTGGANWTNSANWMTDAPLEDWYGVRVDALGAVTALDLRQNGLGGSIPPEIGALSNLEQLNLGHNFYIGGRIPASLGELRDLETLDLGWNDFSGPIPPELGKLAKLRSLALYGNAFDGEIPQELRRLTSLENLDLRWNGLTGEIPSWLGYLSNLRWLSLSSNALTGEIPWEIGSLTNLRRLGLGHNDLSGPIPPQLGGLSNLWELYLVGSGLAGEISRELSGLSNLGWLYLGGNELTGEIPSWLGDLRNLHGIHFGENGFSGEIPPDLGQLSNLRELHLGGNDLYGAIPPSFAGLARLYELDVSHNRGLVGAVPPGLRNVPLDLFMAGGTGLCVPPGPETEQWLASILRQRIARCEPPAAYLVQAVQSLAHPVPLVAGKDALLRVFPVAAMETTVGMPEVRARFFINGLERHVAEIPGGSVPIPTAIDEQVLANSANAEVPAGLVRPGLEMVIEVDPAGELDASLGLPRRIPAQGRLAVDVREMPTLDLTVIPFLWTSKPDSAILGLVEGMAADPDGHPLLEDTHALLPVGNVRVTAHAPVATTSNNAYDLLSQTRAIRAMEGGVGHYKGMLSGDLTGTGGVASLGGRASFSQPNSGTMAHELGHNMGLEHAPCGGAGLPDRSFPYANGAIGAWGYDFGSRRLVPATTWDHMSYCDPAWTSDYHFTNALAYRMRDAGAASSAGTAVGSLLLWGGVDGMGTPFLNPAFAVDARPALPDSAGDYTVTGRDASGRDLFSLSFAMQIAQSEEADIASFVFLLPVPHGWQDRLATILLEGPAGDATLDSDSYMPMAILRDAASGQVRGFLRGESAMGYEAVGTAARQVGGRRMDVFFSLGIPGNIR